MSNRWTLEQAVNLCSMIHPLTIHYGCYVALTGGVLYKGGERKDLDLLFYRIRQVPGIDKKRLFDHLETQLNIKVVKGFGFCHKATFEGKSIDILFPEEDRFQTIEGEGQYEAEDPEPDPRPADVLVAAVIEAQCEQGNNFSDF